MIRNLIAFVFLAVALIAQRPIVVENLAQKPATCWVYCAMPVGDVPKGPCILTDGQAVKAVAIPSERGVRFRGTWPPGRTKVSFAKGTASASPFVLAVDVASLEPHWAIDPGDGTGAVASEPLQYWPLGAQQPGPHFAQLVERDEAHQLWHVRTQVPRYRMTFDLWATVCSGQATVDWASTAVYGDTRNDGHSLELDLPHAYLWCRAPVWRDFAAQNGLGQAVPHGSDGWSALPIHQAPSALMQGRRIVTRGAFNATEQRKAGQVVALYLGWSGDWFGMQTPTLPRNWREDLAAARALFDAPPRGSLWDLRPYVQPRWAETTGEQQGFGSNVLGRAVTIGEPWFLLQMLYSCDAYALRPTANKEPDGSPFEAAKHDTVTFNGAVHLASNPKDACGWAGNGQPLRTFWDGYMVSEQQHRDARSLHATYVLTGDPLLRSVIDDLLQVEIPDAYRLQGRCGAARAAGRLLLDYTGAVWAGFDAYRPLVDSMVSRVIMEKARHPGELSILGELSEAVYGWRVKDQQLSSLSDPQSQPIIGPQSWQQSIAAVQGCWSAWLICHDERARDLAIAAARIVTDVCWYQLQPTGPWLHVYAWNWNSGSRPPASAYDGGTNIWQTTNPACDYWSAAACELLAAVEPDTELGRKAKAIVAQFGTPRTWVESQWRSVR